MNTIQHKHPALLQRILSAFIAVSFAWTTIIPPTQAQVLNLPPVGQMITMSPQYSPAIIKGIKIFPNNPLRFDFIIDTGDSGLSVGANPRIRLDKGKNITGENMVSPLHKESQKLIKYFLASLTVPEENLWVNLSPYEKDRIIPNAFGQTEMGRDLLAQDYILKQLMSSLMYPEEELGKSFWDKIYQKAYELFGTTTIPINTFNKVWIMPEKAVVYENEDTAFVVESRLKVMLEEDYLAIQHNTVGAGSSRPFNGQENPAPTNNKFQSQIIRDVILPAIEKEVNEGEHFANLRQIYNSMILAAWFKQNLHESILGRIYVDQNKTKGVDIEDTQAKQKIYNQYLKAFKVGVYDYIKEDVDLNTKKIIPRKYFSGGFKTNLIGSSALETIQNPFDTPSEDGYRQGSVILKVISGKNRGL